MATVPIRYRRVFPHPLADAYAWLTDYQDDDPARTDAVQVRRHVLERSDERVLMEGTLDLMGNTGSGKVEVRLMPPDHWQATLIEGAGRGSVYDYRLTALTPTSTRLDVVYNVRVKRLRKRLLVMLAAPFVRRHLDRMWKGFADAMARDLRETRTAEAPAAHE